MLFIVFVAIAVFSLFAFSLLATPYLRESATSKLANELVTYMHLTEDSFVPLILKHGRESAMQARAVMVAREANCRVTLIDLSGKVLADSATKPKDLPKLENHISRPEVIEALARGEGASARYSPTVRQNYIYIAKTLKDGNNRVIGIIRFSIPSKYVNETVISTHKSLLISLVITIGLAVIISFLLSTYLSSPITRLTNVARDIAEGRFPQTIIKKSPFELKKLEESIEEMSKALAVNFSRLNNESSKISAILGSMKEGVLAIDAQDKVILANPAIERMFSVVEPEIIGKSIRAAILNNEIADLTETVKKSGKEISNEIEIITPFEGVFMAHASPIVARDSSIIGVVCVLHDITDVKKLEKYRSEFVANVSHELKTPLTAIRNYVETLLSGAISDRENNVKFLQIIDKHAQGLTALIDDILEVSKLESGRGAADLRAVDLRGTIEKAIETINEKARKKGISIKYDAPPNEYLVSGQEDQLYRAVLNLLDNAVVYSNSGGEVRVQIEKKDQHIELSVIDRGIGIPHEHIHRIFERFYRVDKARSREMGGTGLGLSIVKHIMNIHHGMVKVESEYQKGSIFTLIFPLPQ